MAQPAPALQPVSEPAHLHALLAAEATREESLAEWGYEAADPVLQARLWGDSIAVFENPS